jgi:hypothetical protein
MPDYYALLARRVEESKGDPAKLRQLVYEAARLSLQRQVHLHSPPLTLPETKRQMSELEAAIARLEADAADRVDFAAKSRGDPETGDQETGDAEKSQHAGHRHDEPGYDEPGHDGPGDVLAGNERDRADHGREEGL